MVLRKLQLDCAPHVSDGRPTAEMFRTCWPRARAFQRAEVMALIPLSGTGFGSAATPASANAAHVSAPLAKAVPKKRLR